MTLTLAPLPLMSGNRPVVPLRPAMLPLAVIPALPAFRSEKQASESWPQSSAPDPDSLRILYNNDPHEKFKALPYLVSAFRLLSGQGTAQNRDVLRLNAGDNNVGKEDADWKLNTRLLNLIGYQGVAMGNHEMDMGSDQYAQALSGANFPTLLSNMDIQPGSALHRQLLAGKIRSAPQIIRQGQHTYGLIGLTTPGLGAVVSTQAKLNGARVQTLQRTFETARAQVQWLQSQGVNRVLVVSHMGYENDLKLARAVPGIDVIVGGHSHHTLRGIQPGRNWVKSPSGEPVLILQAGKNAQWVGVADVKFTPEGQVIPLGNQLVNPFAFAPDSQATTIKNATLGQAVPLARIQTATDADGNEFHPDLVAQFTADSARNALGTDIALIRSTEVRGNMTPGVLTDQDLKALMPFTDPMLKVQLRGDEILAAFQRAGRGLVTRETHPGMLHPAGLAVTLNQQTGDVLNARVLNRATRQWEPLNPNRFYSVALGEFSVCNNREFPELAKPERIIVNSGQPARNFFLRGLQQAGAPFRPISFQDNGCLNIR